MKCYISAVCALSVLVALSYAAPMPQESQGTDSRTQTTQIVNGINSKIMLLRQYCPQIFQVIDNVIQNVTSTAFRVIGRVILRSGGLGGGGGGGGGDGDSSGGSRVSVVLPTFGPDDDDYDDDEDEDNSVGGSSSSTTEASTTTTTTTTTASSTNINDDDIDIRVSDARKPPEAIQTSINEVASDALVNTDMPLYTSPAGSVARRKRESSRTIRAAEDQAENDQDAAASGGNGPSPSDDLSNVEADDADRDKRFLPFGGTFGAGASGSAGGSGNFLFDIIRRTADGAARAAGTVYRMIAGTENLGLGLTATATSSRSLPQLVAGSGQTEESDEKENAPIGAGGVAEIDVAKGGDGLTEGIPGPITRLFVLANRGLANLVQDLILRLAQTSERIVNFKARLITALI